jgi:thioredoxin reductase
LITPELAAAIGIGLAGIISAWFTGRAKLKKVIFADNDSPERRKDTITMREHTACRDERKETENRLFKGQKDLEKEIKEVRKENREDFQHISDKIDQKFVKRKWF